MWVFPNRDLKQLVSPVWSYKSRELYKRVRSVQFGNAASRLGPASGPGLRNLQFKSGLCMPN